MSTSAVDSGFRQIAMHASVCFPLFQNLVVRFQTTGSPGHAARSTAPGSQF